MPDVHKVSFRGQLKGEVSDFVERVGMACVETTQSLVDLIVELSHYEEEGKILYPKILICDLLPEALALLQGNASLQIGRGPKSPSTAQQALKKCAPLAQEGWSIYIERHPDEFRYGVFREPELPTALDIRNTLASLPSDSIRAILACQISERAVELVGTEDRHMHVHFSAVGVDQPHPSASLAALVAAATRDAPEGVSESLKSYLTSVLGRALLRGHGALLAVIRLGETVPPSLASDGITLTEPIELSRFTEDFLGGQSMEAVLTLTAYGTLLEGMLGSDGITLLRSDGAIMGFNYFIKRVANPNTPASELIGGARRRAYDSLCRAIDNGEVLCAFIRSSNGSSDHKIRVEG